MGRSKCPVCTEIDCIAMLQDTATMYVIACAECKTVTTINKEKVTAERVSRLYGITEEAHVPTYKN